ncbi:MAG: hypothetical protein EBT51_12765, partial [Flavobacteriaceae bacterium]|nr:hypothetical protein [Flavobacteriaceae bacterium]
AGEWRNGDLVVEKRDLERVTAVTLDLIRVDNVLHGNMFEYECNYSGVIKRSPQARFINITEMQRALGRI